VNTSKTKEKKLLCVQYIYHSQMIGNVGKSQLKLH